MNQKWLWMLQFVVESRQEVRGSSMSRPQFMGEGSESEPLSEFEGSLIFQTPATMPVAGLSWKRNPPSESVGLICKRDVRIADTHQRHAFMHLTSTVTQSKVGVSEHTVIDLLMPCWTPGSLCISGIPSLCMPSRLHAVSLTCGLRRGNIKYITDSPCFQNKART